MNLKAWHAAYTVSDMDRALPFYTEQLGLKLVRDAVCQGDAFEQLTGYPNARLRVAVMEDSAGFLIELIEYLEPRGEVREFELCDPGAGHLSFQVDDLEAAYDQLSEAGATFQSPPVELARDGQVVGWVLYLYDPDGNIIEMYQPARG